MFSNTIYVGVISLISNANPTIALVTAASDLVIGLISRILKMNKDDQIMYAVGSFNDKIDDLGVKYGAIVQKSDYARIKYQALAG